MKASFVVTLDWPTDTLRDFGAAQLELARSTIQRVVEREVKSAGIHVTTTHQKGLPLHPFPTP